MEKRTRAEVIASLVTDRFSGFKDGDEAILEAAADARLEEFRAASESRQTAATATVRLETENRNIAARLKVAEDRVKAAEQPMTKEEFLQKAPAEYKTLLENAKVEEDAQRASLVSQLKDCGADTEEELKKKSVDELRTLAKYARVEVIDFSGRGLAINRNAADGGTNYAPPNPYEAGLKALQAQTTKH